MDASDVPQPLDWSEADRRREDAIARLREPEPLSAGDGIGLSNNAIENLAPSASQGAQSSTADDTGTLTPLKLVKGSLATELRVVYGTIQGIAGGGMNLGDVPPYEFVPVGSSGYVWAAASLNADFSGFSSFAIDSGATVPGNSTSTIYIELGSFTTIAGVKTPAHALSGSQFGKICGSATSEVPMVTWALV